MEENARYYREVEGVEEKWFNPRAEAVDYVNRDNDEEALLNFIESSYVFDDVAEDPEEVSIQKSETSSSENELDNDEFIAKWSEDEGKYILEEKNSVIDDFQSEIHPIQ